MKKVLVPPPATRADEIVAAMGGMFYAQEAPRHAALRREGLALQGGDPLYIIEVMKMFNKVLRDLRGHRRRGARRGSGAIVQKGQPLFKVTPDEKIVVEDPKERAKRVRATTTSYLDRACS